MWVCRPTAQEPSIHMLWRAHYLGVAMTNMLLPTIFCELCLLLTCWGLLSYVMQLCTHSLNKESRIPQACPVPASANTHPSGMPSACLSKHASLRHAQWGECGWPSAWPRG